ncbi:MFS transporter [Ahrensia sp. R2A130]|uniref:MFS transporter n=1 Tax=Ahrensia sp. R2A130 TaxID=744979 RepID=UPI0001E0E86A|nr:MFS transporter [Ahrensia sp. R2A130]EFL90400.1 major facilitator transporter [Ahrensia sp. R2A130]
MNFYAQNARWLVGGFLLAMFSGFGQTFYISIWGAEIREAFDLSHGGFGLVYLVGTLASALTMPFVGRLVDVTSVAVTASIVIVSLAIAAASMAVVQSVWLLIVTIYLLRLFGQGMMTHTAITAMGRWYSANRGKAVSVASIGHQFAEGLAPLTFVWIAGWLGWRGSWLAASAVLLFVALPVIVLLMRVERVPQSATDVDGYAVETGRQWTRAEMLRDPLFWLAGLGIFSPAFIGTSIFFHQDYLIDLNGWSRTSYDLSFAVMAIITVSMSLLTGYAVDRFSAARLLPIFMAPLAAACFVLGSFTNPATLFIFMVLLGLSYGMTSTLFGSIWPEVYGTRNLGSLRSVTVSLMVFMSAAGPGATGALIDYGIPFTTQLIFMGMFCSVSIIAMWFASQGFLARRRPVAPA